MKFPDNISISEKRFLNGLNELQITMLVWFFGSIIGGIISYWISIYPLICCLILFVGSGTGLVILEIFINGYINTKE